MRALEEEHGQAVVPAVLRSGDAGEMVVAAWGKDEEGGLGLMFRLGLSLRDGYIG